MAVLSKWLENIVRKGEIAHYEQFLLFPQCFQKTCFPEALKYGDYYDFRIGNGAVLKSSSQWQLKEF